MGHKVTHERLTERLDYDPATGVFRWRHNGRRAGTPHVDGYIQIMIDYRPYREHRLAWLYVHGAWPPDQIDHINGVRTDNRIANLRLASHTENSRNRKVGKNNLIGVKGVSHQKKRYRAEIQADGRRIVLGTFATAEEAHAAYSAAAEQFHGQFARTA